MRKVRGFLAVFVLGLMMSFPLAAQARGIVLWNTGDEIFEVAAFPADYLAKYPDANAYKLGYKCSRLAIFWADLWTWDCKLSAVSADLESYADLDAEDAAAFGAKYSMKDAHRGFWNHYGALTALLLLGGLMIWGMFNKDEAAAPASTEAEMQNDASSR